MACIKSLLPLTAWLGRGSGSALSNIPSETTVQAV